MSLSSRKHGKNVGWLAYDPDLMDWGAEPKQKTSETFAIIFFVPLTIAYLLYLGKSPFAAPPLQQLAGSLWISAFMAFQPMFFGNSSLVFPRLVLLITAVKIGLAGALWLHVQPSTVFLMPESIATAGLLALALPPLKGPLMHKDVDPVNPEHYPPVNLGNVVMKTLGFIVLIIGMIWIGVSLFDWRSAKVPSMPEKSWMNWGHLFVSGILIYSLALAGGNVGSMSSIKRPWHAQTVYYKCIMPNVQKVCGPSFMLGTAVGLGIYIGLSFWMGGDWLIPVLAGLAAGFPAALLMARRRGKRIYTEALRREGIALY